MKLHLPVYYKKFHCIANKCKNNCCSAGWEIDIDPETLKNYNQVSKPLNEKLEKNISLTPSPHFILKNNGACPFLMENKLCEIYSKLGETNLCLICKEHPRYYETFNKIKEGGIGLCCEETARIILTQTDKFQTYEIEIQNEASDKYNQKLYTYLLEVRKNIINYIELDNISLSNKLKDILWYSQTIQQNIDFNLLDDEEIIHITDSSKSNLESLLKFYLTLEPNKISWIQNLQNCIDLYSEYEKNIAEFEKFNPKILQYLKNISIYFIWRYFLKGVFDEDILSKIKLMISSILVLKYLFFCRWYKNEIITLEDCIDITTKYSEEIEYSEENIYQLAKNSYDLDFFDTQELLSML